MPSNSPELVKTLSDIRDALEGIHTELARIAPHFVEQYQRSQNSDLINQMQDIMRNKPC
jgi:hypothetical protein